MKTKKSFRFLCLFGTIFFFQLSLIGQDFYLKSGLSLSKFTQKEKPTDHIVSLNSLPSLFLAIDTEFAINESFQIETGLSLNTKGNREEYFKDEDRTQALFHDSIYAVNMVYLDIPILAKFYFYKKTMKFYAACGPYFSIALDGHTTATTFSESQSITVKEKINWGSKNEINTFRRADYGLVFNLGAELRSFKMGVAFGLGMHDLSTFNDAKASKIRNRTWNFYVGYKLFDKRSS